MSWLKAPEDACAYCEDGSLYEALCLGIVVGIAMSAHRADETMFGQSSCFQPVAQLDHRRRVPLAAGRARYLASG